MNAWAPAERWEAMTNPNLDQDCDVDMRPVHALKGRL
jgi:hypothetical protein